MRPQPCIESGPLFRAQAVLDLADYTQCALIFGRQDQVGKILRSTRREADDDAQHFQAAFDLEPVGAAGSR